MAIQDADPPSQSTFTCADKFFCSADVFLSRDFDEEPPTTIKDAEEQQVLSELCAMLDKFQEQLFLLTLAWRPSSRRCTSSCLLRRVGQTHNWQASG
ncbi:uncharacterized protein JCM10292_005752 [Rhodotorula paludigena]|uniref:uncharacterized protein n=1 Tax=Rhodotorula paludigena TaxID=86838 RepID=UPI00316CCE60